jgi:DNA-directed RNA polymerase omega subunit
MKRISTYDGYTSEEAALKIGNLYDMVLVASARAREIKKKKINTFGHRETKMALQEVENGKVGREYLKKVK